MEWSLDATAPLEPPADVPEVQRGNWFALPAGDPVAEYLGANLWDRPEEPDRWEAARLSQAVYVYRERLTGWATAAKFYAVKTGTSAEKHARREAEAARQAWAAGLAEGEARAIRPLAVWRGVLFLEYVDGLSLEDVIAVRRSRPGTLVPCLEGAARILATLHARGTSPHARPDFEAAAHRALEYVDTLSKHGVLEDDPVAAAGLARAIDRWAARPMMQDFVPTLTHGDATTSNFVFPWAGGIVILDWERLEVSDPAADLGRLKAEVSHSVTQHGGSVAEAEPFVQCLVEAYTESLPAGGDAAALLGRARFYRAASTLRIARNGWIPRLDRTVLVAQALALLA